MDINTQMLQVKLMDFGLNPAEWILESQDRIGNLFQMCVRHSEDGDLILQGWALSEAWITLSYQG